MIAKKRLAPMLVTVLMVFSVVPILSSVAYAFDTEVVIPADVTVIKAGQFRNMERIESVTFMPGSKLELIENDAFSGCTALTDITIPAGVKKIGYDAFRGSGLESVTFLKGSKLEVIYDSAFAGCENLGSITIPASTKAICYQAFFETGLQSVEFEQGSKLETIDEYAFADCMKLKSITIPANVTSINKLAFYSSFYDLQIHYLGTRAAWMRIADGVSVGHDVHFVNYRITKATPETFGEEKAYCPSCQEYLFNTVIEKPERFTLSAGSYTYDGSEKTPDVTVTDSANKTINESDYDVSYSQNVKAGTATATVTFTGDYYAGSKELTFTINKAANPLTTSPKTAAVKFSKLKKKARSLAVSKVMTFTKDANDKKTYTLSSAKKGKKSFKKYFKINKTTGKVKVKKGLKKGVYKVKAKVQALGNGNYKASAVNTVTFKVKVK